jgi:hypothetical protein
MSFITRDQAGGAFSADAVRYATDRLGNGAYFLPDSDGQGNDLIVAGNLTVEGTSALKGAVTVGTSSVAAPTLLNGTLSVNGATALTGPAQCGSGFTVGGGLSVVTGNISAASGVTSALQAVTCTTLGASGNVGSAGNIDVSGSVLIGTYSPSVQQQIKLVAGPPQSWAPVSPFLEIGDNTFGNAALKVYALRVQEMSSFTGGVNANPGQTQTGLGPFMEAAGTYMLTISETQGVAPSSGLYVANSAIITIAKNAAAPGTLMVAGNLPVVTANGVSFTLTYGTFGGIEGMYMDITNTNSSGPQATFLITSTCLSLTSYA